VFEIGVKSDQGRVRQINQDAVLVDIGQLEGDEYALLAVADGMGGHRAGEVASQMAIDSFAEQFLLLSNQQTEPLLALEMAARRANQQIHRQAESDYRLAGMGTTLTAAFLWRGQLQAVHVGDSRLYLHRTGNCQQLTDDHSLVGELLKSGNLSEQEAQQHPRRNVLIRALGASASVEVDLLVRTLQPDDVVLLCSDGLSTALSHTELAALIGSYHHPQQAVDAMVQAANEQGGVDNITAVMARWRWERP
jgi:serine/threonine protein phosphatase PrpC